MDVAGLDCVGWCREDLYMVSTGFRVFSGFWSLSCRIKAEDGYTSLRQIITVCHRVACIVDPISFANVYPSFRLPRSLHDRLPPLDHSVDVRHYLPYAAGTATNSQTEVRPATLLSRTVWLTSPVANVGNTSRPPSSARSRHLSTSSSATKCTVYLEPTAITRCLNGDWY